MENSAISDKEVKRYHANRFARSFFVTGILFFVGAPYFCIGGVRYKKAFLVFPILFTVAVIALLSITVYGDLSLDYSSLTDEEKTLYMIDIYLQYVLNFLPILTVVVAYIFLCVLASKPQKRIKLVIAEVYASGGKKEGKEFTRKLVALSKAGDVKGFNEALDSAHNAFLYHSRNIETCGCAETKLEYEGRSAFDGGVLSRFGWSVLCFIVSVASLGIAYPVAVCWKMRWQKTHTVYQGKRLSFDGNGGQLIVGWLLWILFSVLTLGIYAFTIPKRLEEWKAKHTHIAGEIKSFGGGFDGNCAAFLGYALLTALLSVITLGLALPAALCMKERWLCSHRIYDGKRLKFNGGGGGLFGQYIKWFLLSLITIGIYSIWVPNKYLKWKAERTVLCEKRESIL